MNDTGNRNLLNESVISKLQRHHLESGPILFSIFTLFILVIGILFFALSFNRPYVGIVLSENNQTWSVENVDPNGIAFKAGIQAGDVPVEINNQPARPFLSDYNDSGVVYGFVIKEITVINKSGRLLSANLQNNSPSSTTVIELLMWFITCLIFWIVGFYVFFKRPRNVAARLLCLCGMFFGLTLGANMAAQRTIPVAVAIAPVAMAVSPYLLLHLFLVLPEERAYLRKSGYLFLIYLPAAITIIIFFLIGYEKGQPVPWFRTVRLIELIVVLIAVAGVAIYNYVYATSARTRQQMKIMLVSAVAAFFPFLLFNFLFSGEQNGVPFGFNVLFISFIPIGMAYAIITQKLLDIDIIIRRSVIYGIITIVMAIIMAAGILPIFAIHTSIGFAEEILIALVLGAVATVLFGPVQKSTELLVDRLFYKDRYDYRHIIQDLSNSLNRLSDFDDISRLIVLTANNTLNLSGACLFTRTDSSYELRAAIGAFSDLNKQSSFKVLCKQDNYLNEFPNYMSQTNPDIAFLIRLVASSKEVGVLFISPKASRQNFSNNDIYLLQGIALLAASTLNSALLVHDVSIQNTFISIASHELRTPLTAIVGFTDLLLHKTPVPDDETKQKWLKTIYEKAIKLSGMTDELLNVSRIQSGKIRMRLEPVNLDFVLDEQVTMAMQVTDKHEFIISIDPGLPETLVDRDKFGHVIGNLLSNAIKYSPQGGHIVVAAHHDVEGQRIIVSVSDEGIGIGSKDKQTLFTTFHRIQRPETVSISGYGLGLYIAKEWTEAMGGEIWMESELNKGTTFFIGIPAINSARPPDE